MPTCAKGQRGFTVCGPTVASLLPLHAGMLKLLGSIALARLLGFGIIGFIVIYALISLLS